MQPPEPPSTATRDDRPTIALVGASVRAAAQSACRGGYRVIGIDRFGDTDTREICDEFYLLPTDEPLARIAVGNLTVRHVGGLRSHSTDWQTESETAESPERWRNFEDLEEFASEPLIRFPPQLPCGEIPPAGRWLRKRWDSSGGLGVHWATANRAPANRAPANRAPANRAPMTWDSTTDHPSKSFLQRWIEGTPMGATFISDGHRAQLVGVCRSLVTSIGSLPMVYAGSIGPVAIESGTAKALNRFGIALAAARPLKGLFNVDFVLDENNAAWILEVNPRWSASMELIERNLRDQDPSASLLGFGLRAEAGEWVSLQCAGESVFKKEIRFAEQTDVFERGSWEASLQPDQTLHDIPSDGTVIQPGHPICTVIGRVGR